MNTIAVNKIPSPTLMQHGEHGSVATSAQRQLRPAEVDRAIQASLPPSVESALIPSHNFPHDGPSFVIDYQFYPTPPVEDLTAALAVVNARLAPCPAATIKRSLARLRAVTLSRDDGEDNLVLTLAAYAEELREHTEDAVVEACLDWGRTHKWWPALSELLLEIWHLEKKRRTLARAITRAIEDITRPKPPSPREELQRQAREAERAERRARQ